MIWDYRRFLACCDPCFCCGHGSSATPCLSKVVEDCGMCQDAEVVRCVPPSRGLHLLCGPLPWWLNLTVVMCNGLDVAMWSPYRVRLREAVVAYALCCGFLRCRVMITIAITFGARCDWSRVVMDGPSTIIASGCAVGVFCSFDRQFSFFLSFCFASYMSVWSQARALSIGGSPPD